ncbi:hypothetical protein [Sphingobium sp. TCM1]|uniref:hypothetical protein n=1 Tax=Sphingobium sp. TCM1 TaxID=453246 RepID=UPI0007F4181D|nr:hypothetical protein A7Q26_13280 [Sphingobium sp. TCM1]
MVGVAVYFPSPSAAQPVTGEQAMRAAIHPVATDAEMRLWLSRVPVTRDFPPDFQTMLRSQASLYVIEISTAPGCLPCGDLWAKLQAFRTHYGWQVRTLGAQEAMLRSGRLGLPWVGNPVAWVRPVTDPNRMVPIAIGTDHEVNIARNAWLAARMLTGARAVVGVRAMSKFTGIVGVRAPASSSPKGR